MSDHETPGTERPPTPPPPDPPPSDPSGPPWSQRSRPPQRSLTRRSNDRVLGGVAGGLGDYFNVDPAIFRLVFVGLSFFGGTGLVLYVLGWLFLPDRDTATSHAEALLRNMGGPRSVAPWIFGGIILLIVVNSSGVFDTGLIWAVILVGAGVLFYRHNDRAPDDGGRPPSDPARAATATAPPPDVGTTPQPPFEATKQRPPAEPAPADPEQWYASTAVTDDIWRPTPYVGPPTPPPPPSVLGRITVAAVLIICGVLALLDSLTALDLAPDRYAALAVIVVGAGLLVGARFGRSRGLIVLGVVLLITMAVAATVRNLASFDGAGQRVYRPATLAEVRDTYEFGVGSVTIDLTELALEPGDTVDIEGAVGMGELIVEVPPDATVTVDASSGIGTLQVFDRESSGTGAELTQRRAGDDGAPTIALDLTAGLGAVDVHDGTAAVTRPQPATSPGVN